MLYIVEGTMLGWPDNVSDHIIIRATASNLTLKLAETVSGLVQPGGSTQAVSWQPATPQCGHHMHHMGHVA